MRIWVKSTIEGAGFSSYGTTTVIGIASFSAFMVGLFAASITSIPAFGVCLGVGALGFAFEALTLRARVRRRAFARLWPEVIDSMISAASAGISLAESLSELAEDGPEQLRPYFKKVVEDFDSGVSMSIALERLKRDLAEIHADRLIELTKVVIEAGGEGYVSALKAQAQLTRDDLALWGELESKQGWISGTAKLAVAAPWLIIAMLSIRPENAMVYASTEGSAILIVGLVVSLIAYRLIHLLGSLSFAPRVFAS